MDVGVIGTGMMGKNHARVYAEMRQVDTLYLHDLDPVAVSRVATTTGGTVVPDLERMIDRVDAVSLVVPTRFHQSYALRLAEAGVPMLIEKPICATIPEAVALRAIRSKVAVGHIERFNPVVAAIASRIRDPAYIGLTRHNPGSARITDVSVAVDLMIHDIDILYHALCPGQEFTVDGRGSPDDQTAVAFFSGGPCPAVLSASRVARARTRQIYVEDAEYTLVGDLLTHDVYLYRDPNSIERIDLPKQDNLRCELTAFLAWVAGGPAFPVTVDQAIRNLAVSLAITDQIRGAA